MTTHGGFYIPNATGVPDTKMSEPDQIDFNIIGNDRWGVVTGCSVSVSGTGVSITPGMAVVDGSIVVIPNTVTDTLSVGSTLDRFDLVGLDASGASVIVQGTPASDPVFPDPPTTVTVLASVFVPATSADLGTYVVDKRNILQAVAVSTNPAGDATILVNRDVSLGVNTFRINAEGRIEWNGDTSLRRTGADTLAVSGALTVPTNLTVGGTATAVTLTASGLVTGSNLRNAGSLPGSADPGTILQSGGVVYIRTTDLTWAEVVTTFNSVSDMPGDIRQSMRTPAEMPGYAPFNGAVLDEATYPHLFDLSGLDSLVSGTAPNRVITLPDLTNRVLMTSWAAPGVLSGSNTLTLQTSQMPNHNHSVTTTSSAPDHIHNVTTTNTAGDHVHSTYTYGEHTHGVTDPGHAHNGAKGWGGSSGWAFISVAWGGTNKLDGPVNDASHTYSVEPMQWTSDALTGVQVNASYSAHSHQLLNAGNHEHTVSMQNSGAHAHSVAEQNVGGGAAIDITPRNFTVYTYLKV
jgi:microcystin-dependent protein